MDDVEEEAAGVIERCNIYNFEWKRRKRKYVFDDANIPREAEYLKVVYGYDEPQLPKNMDGITFSHIFGTNTGPLEQFLIKRKIMGPCWLAINDVKINDNEETWCKVEFRVEDPKACSPMRDADGNILTKGPPLVIMSLKLKTIMNLQKNSNEIIAASAVILEQANEDEPTPKEDQLMKRFAVIRQLEKQPYPDDFYSFVSMESSENCFQIVPQRTESALLNYLTARIHTCDPDIILGHNFTDFDLDILLRRMKDHNVLHWHKIGRLKRKGWPRLQSGSGGIPSIAAQQKKVLTGRIICDTYLASRDLVRAKSYQLTDLARSELSIVYEDMDLANLPQIYTNALSLIEFLRHCSFEAYLAVAIMNKLQILPLTKELTNLAGNLWSRSMNGSRSDRNEFLLLHSFHDHKFLCPDKKYKPDQQRAILSTFNPEDEDSADVQSETLLKEPKIASEGQNKTSYSGGLVLEPKRGFYGKYVLVLDFNSLYPSIIQEFNICFTTVNYRQHEEEINEENVPQVPDKSMPLGLLPRLVKTFVDQRKQVKLQLKNSSLSPAEKLQYNIKQQALKLTANSMYGCLGSSHSRFYARPLAMLITSEGRRILQDTANLAENLHLNVIYGDTDSIMIFTESPSLKEAKFVAEQLQKEVNTRYSLLEIGVDAIFKYMLLLQKKKYAALAVEEKENGDIVESIETKGIDLVRRDWCDLSREVSMWILKIILSERKREDIVRGIHATLLQVGKQVRSNAVKLEKFVIYKQLTKNVNDYGKSNSHPHVEVAKRMRAAGASVKAGDTIPYVICQAENDQLDRHTSSVATRAYPPDYVKNGIKKIDLEWYLAQQVHPPVVRLCMPIAETDVAQLADCL
ncbi:DNA-directed DNA polymerase alpha catalytic subunit pol1, partial [Apophysomyces sp. BC1021]